MPIREAGPCSQQAEGGDKPDTSNDRTVGFGCRVETGIENRKSGDDLGLGGQLALVSVSCGTLSRGCSAAIQNWLYSKGVIGLFVG